MLVTDEISFVSEYRSLHSLGRPLPIRFLVGKNSGNSLVAYRRHCSHCHYRRANLRSSLPSMVKFLTSDGLNTTYVLMFWLWGCLLSWLLNYTGMILSSLYWKFHHNEGLYPCSVRISFWVMIITTHANTKSSPWKSERESFFFWIVLFMVCCLYVWMTNTRAVTCTSVVVKGSQLDAFSPYCYLEFKLILKKLKLFQLE